MPRLAFYSHCARGRKNQSGPVMPVDGRMEMGLKGGDSVDLGGVLNLSNKNNQTAINTDEDDDDDEDDDEEDEEETTADHHQPDPDSDQEPNNFRNHLMKNFD